MNVLTVNCGSSSLKMRLCAVEPSRVSTLAGGAVEAIGAGAVATFQSGDGAQTRSPIVAEDHGTALRALLQLLPDGARRSIEAVGHRVVQGGAFTVPTIIDDEVIRAVEAVSAWRPSTTGPRSMASSRRGRSCLTSRWSPSTTRRSTTRCPSTRRTTRCPRS